MVQMNHTLAIANILFPREAWEDRVFRLKFRHAHLIARSPEAWPAKSVSGILGRIGSPILLVNLKRTAAVHQHVGIIF